MAICSVLFLLLLLFVDTPQPQVLLKQGLVALQRGDLSEAQSDFEQASAEDPRNPYIWSSLAETYLRLNDPNRAVLAAKEAEKSGIGNAVAAHALGIFYLHYADFQLHREQFTEAADLLTEALKTHPKDAQLTLALGVARYGQRRFNNAIEAFIKVIQIDPEMEQPYLFLGKMLDQAGAHLPSIAELTGLWAQKHPEDAQAQLVLAKVLLAQNSDCEKCEALLRRSVQLGENDWEAHYELGLLLEQRHQYGSAAVELKRGAELAPTQSTPHYHLARVYDRLGDHDRAAIERSLHQQLVAPAENK